MFYFRKPSPDRIRRFLADQVGMDLTYAAVGATAAAMPAGYRVNHTRVRVGRGEDDFRAAKDALRGWEQFDLGWVEAGPRDTPIEVGLPVAILARSLGVWWLNACRVVAVVDEPHRFGFAYGTLPGHAGTGEERFLIEWDPAAGDVWYDILAFSRPHQLLARIGSPYMRLVQRRFGSESAAAMLRAVRLRAGARVPVAP
ncbi:MAG: DUF1990 family protein [Gemmataceae bacterium]